MSDPIKKLSDINLENLPSTSPTEGIVGDAPTRIPVKKIEDLDIGFLPIKSETKTQQEALQHYRAIQQPWYEQATSGIVGGVASGLLTAIEDLSYLPQVFEENWEGNAIAETMQDWKEYLREDLFPIYKESDDLWDWSNGAFVWESLRGVLDSAVGFAIPGGVVSKGINLAGKGVKAMNIAGKLYKTGKTGQRLAAYTNILENSPKYNQIIQSLGAGYVTNDMEGTMMGVELYENTLEQLIEQGIPEKEAMDIAGQKASEFKAWNRMFAITDAIGLHGIYKGKGITRELLKERGLKKRLHPKNMLSSDNFLLQSLKESGEEIGQNILQMESEFKAKQAANELLPDDKKFDIQEEEGLGLLGRAIKYGTSDQALYEGMLGFFGGGPQRLFTEVVSGKYTKSAKDAYDKLFNEQQEIIENNTAYVAENLNSLNVFDSLLEESIKTGQPITEETLRDMKFLNLAAQNFKNGTTENLERQLKDIENLTPEQAAEKGFDENYISQTREHLNKLQEYENEWLKYSGFENGEELFRNRQNRNLFQTQYDKLESELENSKFNLSKEANRISKKFKDSVRIEDGVRKTVPFSYDINNLEENPMKGSGNKTAINQYNSFLKQVKSTPQYIKNQQVEEDINTINEALDTLDSKFNFAISNEGQEEAKKEKEKEIKEEINKEIKQQLLQQKTKQKENKKAKDEETKEKIKAQEEIEKTSKEISKDPDVDQTDFFTLVDKAINEKELDKIQDQADKANKSSAELIDAISIKREQLENIKVSKQEKTSVKAEKIASEKAIQPQQSTEEKENDVEKEVEHANATLAQTGHEISVDEEGEYIYDYSKVPIGNNILAYLSRKFNQFIKDFTISREDTSDEINENLQDANILDPNEYNIGTKITFKVKDEDDIEFYDPDSMEKESTTWGAYKTENNLIPNTPEYNAHVPIVAVSDNIEFAFLHDTSWITEENIDNTTENINDDKEKLNKIRNYTVDKGEFSTTITSKSLGKLFKTKDNSYNPLSEVMQDKNLTIATGGDNALFTGKNELFEKGKVLNLENIKEGHSYIVPQVGLTEEKKPLYIALPINHSTISDEINKSIISAINIHLNTKDGIENLSESENNIRKEIYEETELDISTVQGIGDYISIFLYNYNVGSAKNLKEYLDVTSTKSDIYFVRVNNGIIEYGRGQEGGGSVGGVKNFSKNSDIDLQIAYLTKFEKEFLPNVRFAINNKHLGENTSVPLIKDNKVTTIPYYDLVKENTLTNLLSVELPNGSYAYTIQPVISFDTSSIIKEEPKKIENILKSKQPTEVESQEADIERRRKEAKQSLKDKDSYVWDFDGSATFGNVVFYGKDHGQTKMSQKQDGSPSPMVEGSIKSSVFTTQELQDAVNSKNVKVINQLAKEVDAKYDELAALKTTETTEVEAKKADIEEEQADTIKKIEDELNETNKELDDDFDINDIGLEDLPSEDLPGGYNKDQIDNLSNTIKENKILIEDLGLNKQMSLVNNIASSIHRLTIKKKGKLNREEIFNTWKKRFKNIKELYKIKNNKKGEEEIDKVLNNFKELEYHVEDHLATLRGTKSRTELIEEENQEETEGVMERTTFSDDFSITVDSKNTTSARLRMQMAFIPKRNDDGSIKKNNLYGIKEYMEFDTVYDTLHALLVNTRANWIKMRTVLEQNKTAYPWIEDIIEIFDNAPLHIQNEFVKDMSKHYISMKLLMWQRKNNGAYELRAIDSNLNQISKVITSNWTNDLIKSGTFKPNPENPEEYILDKEYLENQGVFSDFDKWKKGKKPSIEELDNWLKKIGIKLSQETLKELKEGRFRKQKPSMDERGNPVYYMSYRSLFKDVRKSESPFVILMNNFNERKNVSLDVNNPIIETAFKKLANIEARYKTHIYPNATRSGNKTIYTYTNNHFLSERFQELRTNRELLTQLSRLSFNSNSNWLKQLIAVDKNGDFIYDEDDGLVIINKDSKFYKNFNYDYVPLETLKKKKTKSKDNKRLQDLSETEHEIYKIGQFQSEGNEYVRLFYPTMSDKSRMLLITVPKHDTKIELNGALKDETIDVLYDTLVLSEMQRMYSIQNKEDYNANIKNYNKGSKLFHFFPEINNLSYIDSNGNESFIINKENGELNEDAFSEEATNEIKKLIIDYVESLTNEKLEEWKEMGIGINDKTEKNSFLDASYMKKAKGDNKIQYAAKDMVVNYLIGNANMHQLFIGDPAQYYKIEKTTDVNDKVKVVEDIFANIGKRLAADIAPGYDLADSEGFFKVAILKDKEVDSLQVNDYLKKYTKKADKYKEIESTDAQEFTTWKEHIEIMLLSGQLTEEEYDSVYDTLEKENKLTDELFGKVLQPIKPVYVNNKVEASNDVERRVYIKSSSFPLIPQLTQGLEIDKLRKAMEAPGGVDRVAFGTAVKVGSVNTPLNIWNDNGTIKEEIKFTKDNVLTLSRRGFRIQQDMPYKENKSEINIGTQERKLLFLNILETEGFLWNNEEIKGKELQKIYYDTYHKLFKEQKNILYKELDIIDGIPNTIKLQNLLINEAKKRNYSLNDKLGLELDEKGNFKLPLWSSGAADKYESLLNSIINNRIVTMKFPGQSYILGTEEGFQTEIKEGEEAKNIIGKTEGIAFTDSWNGELQGMREDPETGKILPAQVIVPFKFRDDEGNLLSIEHFMTIKDGKNVINTERLPKELLKSFGFRIPTQGLNSMTYIEIVGFLPKASGDLILAPRDFVTQMGSDFDVDKLYTYMYNTFYKNGKLYKNFIEDEKEIEKRLKNAYERIENLLNELKLSSTQKQVFYQTQSDIFNKIREEKDYSLVMQEELSRFIRGRGIEQELQDKFKEQISKENYNIEILKKSKIASLQNKILDIHFSVLSNPNKDVQTQITEPLLYGDLKGEDGDNIAVEIDNYRRTRKEGKTMFTALSDSYQRKKYIEGTISSAGRGSFSLDATFNASAQGKELKLYTDHTHSESIEIKFGEEEISNGDLSRIKTLKENKNISDVIAAFQSAAVDEEKEQILRKINVNPNTFSTIRVLAQLGFEEKTIAAFISQDIIWDYVNKIISLKSSLNGFTPDAENVAFFEILNSYYEKANAISQEEKEKLIEKSEKYKDASSKQLLNAIENGENSIDYYALQIATLTKFRELDGYGKSIKSIQSAIDSDSAGIGKSLFYSIFKEEQINRLPMNQIQNADKLLGDFIYNENKNKYEFINPTTINGFATYYGLLENNKLWKSYFPYHKRSILGDDGVIQEIITLLDKENITIKEKADLAYNIFKDVKSFIYTRNDLGLTKENINEERKKLLIDTKDNMSLASIIDEVKNTDIGINNALLSRLSTTINTNGEPSHIKFTASAGEGFDEKHIYAAFIDLITNNQNIGEFNGEQWDTNKLAANLILHQYLTGGSQEAIQFVKYIPIGILKTLPFANSINSIDFNENDLLGTITNRISVYQKSRFVRQWIQHNAYQLQRVTEEQITKGEKVKNLNDLKTFKLTDKKLRVSRINPETGKLINAFPEFLAIDSDNKILMFEYNGEEYQKIDTLRLGFNQKEYNYNNANQTSVVKSNQSNVNPEVKPTVNLSELEERTIPVGDEKITLESKYGITNKAISGKQKVLNALDIIESKSNNPYFKELATELLNNNEKIPDDIDVSINNNLSGQGMYDYNTNTITLNTSILNTNDKFETGFLHELIHGFTGKLAYTFEKNPEKLSKEEKRILTSLKNSYLKLLKAIESDSDKRKEFLTFYETYYDNLLKQKRITKFEFQEFMNRVPIQPQEGDEFIGTQDFTEEEISKNYGAVKLSEFITMAMTDVEFQKILNSIEDKDGKLWWNTIIDKIKKLLETVIPNLKENSILATTIDDVIELINLDSYIEETTIPSVQPQVEVKEGVAKLFESNPELANAVYEALGFKEKSKQRNAAFSETMVNVENAKIGERVSLHKIFPHIADAFVIKTKDNKYYIEHTEDTFNKEEFENYLLDRFKPTEKVTDVRYLGVTPQQKQQAKQLYSQYLEQTGKQDIEGFKNFVSQPQAGVEPKDIPSISKEEIPPHIEEYQKSFDDINEIMKDIEAFRESDEYIPPLDKDELPGTVGEFLRDLDKKERETFRKLINQEIFKTRCK